MEIATAPLSIMTATGDRTAVHSLVAVPEASIEMVRYKEKQAAGREKKNVTQARNKKKIQENRQAASLEQEALLQGGSTSASKLQAGGKRPRDGDGEDEGGATSKQACTDTSLGIYEDRRLYPADKKSVPPGWTSREESVDTFTGQKEKDRVREARKDKEHRESVARLESAHGRLLSEAAAAAVRQQEFDCFKEYYTRQMEQKEKERAAADAAAAAAAIRMKAVLAKAKEKVENVLEENRSEVAAREAAEANTNRVQALLAKAEEVHPTTYTLHLTPHTLHPTP